jgi:hypothetical protein
MVVKRHQKEVVAHFDPLELMGDGIQILRLRSE